MNYNNDQPKDLLTGELDGIRQIEIEGYEQGVKKARNTLFVIAALVFAGELIMMAIAETGIFLEGVIIALVEAGIFVGLALWTKKKPYTAIVVGIVVYIGLWALTAFIDPLNIVKGILVKIIILGYLFKSLPDAKELQRVKTEENLF